MTVRRRCTSRVRQRGVAVITALLLTTLSVAIVSSLFWQQQVQVRSIENQRLHLQIQWILRGTLDLTSFLLQEDARYNRTSTNLKAVWATPVANTRIDQYIDRDRVQGEVFDASMSGQVLDANARYNLSNLAENGAPDLAQVAMFGQLLTNLSLDATLAARAAAIVAQSQPIQPTQAVPNPRRVKSLAPLALEDLLAVPGFTPAVLDKLRPFVIVLPEKSKVNVHTADYRVIAAMVPNMTLAQAQAVVAQRERVVWKDKTDFDSFQGVAGLNLSQVDVTSEWFLVRSWLKLDRASLNTEALISRKLSGQNETKVVWIHQN